MLALRLDAFALGLLGLFLTLRISLSESIIAKSAVVVGGGPTGMATALVLARRHGYDVTILEAADRTDVYDPTKAYPFLIRERGQKLTKLFPDIQASLADGGIATEGATKLVSVSADPKEIVNTTPRELPMFVPGGTSYWLRRHEFNRIMLDAVDKEENIQIVNGALCKSVSARSDQDIEVCVEQVGDHDVKTKTYRTSLLIAADGMKSNVRDSLSSSPSAFAGWQNNRPAGFKVKTWFSPSSGLKFKTLHMNSEAKVPVGDGSMFQIPFNTPTFYTIKSSYTGAKSAISLGVLPCRPAPTRTFNVIRIPEHQIWNVREGGELRDWFAKAFPRFDFSAESSLVTQEEFDRFASTEGLSLPPVQLCPELYVSSPTSESAVILVGDAVHVFPPDIGEGVNAGLEDVAALDKALSNNEKVGDAAKAYAAERGPECKALVKIARIGAPFQYNQLGGLLTVKRIMWTVNFIVRSLFFKVSGGRTPAPVFTLISDGNVKYSTALKRADRFTASLWGVSAVMMATLLRSIKFGK